MSKRIPSTKNNVAQQIQITSINIDYDKLAEAIVVANMRLNEHPVKVSRNKIGFWKSIWLILLGKKKTEDKLTVGLLSIPLVILFKTVCIIGIVAAIVLLIFDVIKIWDMKWTEFLIIVKNIFSFVGYGFISFGVALFSVIIWGAANEIDRSEDKNFVVAVFSGIVSLVALIVAFVALKG